MELNKILSLAENLENQGLQVVIMGDFNSDIRRKNEFDNILLECTARVNFGIIDVNFSQICNFTYRNREVKSWIDHVLARLSNESISSVKILQDDDNQSDHNAMEIILELVDQIENSKNENKKIKFKWDCMKFVEIYNRIFNEKLGNLGYQVSKIQDSGDKNALKTELSALAN